jgi:hypothetical protein
LARDGEAEEVETAGVENVSMIIRSDSVRVGMEKTYPMDTMIMRDVTAIVRLVNIWWKPSRASK